MTELKIRRKVFDGYSRLHHYHCGATHQRSSQSTIEEHTPCTKVMLYRQLIIHIHYMCMPNKNKYKYKSMHNPRTMHQSNAISPTNHSTNDSYTNACKKYQINIDTNSNTITCTTKAQCTKVMLYHQLIIHSFRSSDQQYGKLDR